MADITGDDLTTGEEVKWYAAGTAAGDEQHTADATDATNDYLALAADAEYGTVVVWDETAQSVVNTVGECSDVAGATPASDGDAVKSITMTITAGHIYKIKYCAITSALVHAVSCKDLKWAANADKKTIALHGQVNKVSKVGAVENSGSMEEAVYNQTLISLALGDQITASPGATNKKHTNAFSGMKKIGGLVGKRFNAAGTCTKKYYIAGVQFEGLDDTYATEDFYTRSLKFSCDYRTEVDLT